MADEKKSVKDSPDLGIPNFVGYFDSSTIDETVSKMLPADRPEWMTPSYVGSLIQLSRVHNDRASSPGEYHKGISRPARPPRVSDWFLCFEHQRVTQIRTDTDLGEYLRHNAAQSKGGWLGCDLYIPSPKDLEKAKEEEAARRRGYVPSD